MILLDIIVLSELIKALPEAAVERWFLMHEEESHLPSSVIGELAFDVRRSAWPSLKLDYANQNLKPRFPNGASGLPSEPTRTMYPLRWLTASSWPTRSAV